MINFNQFNIKKVAEEKNTATFEIGPLPQGYGHTIGTFIRRSLLSSIPGSAITSVKIDGVQHEYTSLAGVSDDVLKVLLSLKNVVVISKTLEPVTLYLDVKGKDGQVVEVTAGDIQKDANIEIVNPDYVITKLTSGKSKFKAEITVERGNGYGLPDEEKRKELSTLPVDALFSPVKLVTYTISQARVGKETELDQINLVVTTNGAIKPIEALHIAADTLSMATARLVEVTSSLLSGKEVAVELNNKQKELNDEQKSERSEAPVRVSDLNLSTRLTNALMKAGYEDLRKLEGFTEEEVANIRGMGSKSYTELLDTLKKHNIKLV